MMSSWRPSEKESVFLCRAVTVSLLFVELALYSRAATIEFLWLWPTRVLTESFFIVPVPLWKSRVQYVQQQMKKRYRMKLQDEAVFHQAAACSILHNRGCTEEHVYSHRYERMKWCVCVQGQRHRSLLSPCLSREPLWMGSSQLVH